MKNRIISALFGAAAILTVSTGDVWGLSGSSPQTPQFQKSIPARAMTVYLKGYEEQDRLVLSITRAGLVYCFFVPTSGCSTLMKGVVATFPGLSRFLALHL